LLSTDGTAALSVTAFSRSGEHFAYGISLSVRDLYVVWNMTLISIAFQGSDFYTVYVRRTSEPFSAIDGEPKDHHATRLPEEIRFVKFSSITWTHDSKGFFYQVVSEEFSIVSGTEVTSSSDSQAGSLMVLRRRIKPGRRPPTIRMLCFITTGSEPHNVRAICFWFYRSALLTNASM
jgi:hypothetical protein